VTSLRRLLGPEGGRHARQRESPRPLPGEHRREAAGPGPGDHRGRDADGQAENPIGRLLLQVERLEVVYHHVATAVQGVSLTVSERTIVALLGTNGAGKTTTLRAISGFLGLDNAAITDGRVTFLGRVVNGQTPHALARDGLVLVPERDKVFETLTVQENLGALVRGERPGPELEMIFELFPVLAQRRRQLAGYLSGGERQMLAIATALLCRPVVLLIDELSLGLAPRVVDALMQLVLRLRNDLDLAVLLVEQNVGSTLEIADYGYVMENGRVVYDGTRERLLAHGDIQEFYLGLGKTAGQKSYTDVKQYRRRRRWF
jgi:branched-chain amino acid transport system ATP-binding protein